MSADLKWVGSPELEWTGGPVKSLVVTSGWNRGFSLGSAYRNLRTDKFVGLVRGENTAELFNTLQEAVNWVEVTVRLREGR